MFLWKSILEQILIFLCILQFTVCTIDVVDAADQIVTVPRKVLHRGNYKEKKEAVVKAIQQRGKKWMAAINPEFEQLNLTDFRFLLGADPVSNTTRIRRPPPAGRKRPPKKGPKGGQGHGHGSARTTRDASLPSSYDARSSYTGCPSLGSIRYQYRCSSCWAVTATSVISDRHCIYNVNTTGQLYFSPFQIISCVPRGCASGNEWSVYNYWMNNGLVTGGTAYDQANQPVGCLPYPYGLNATPSACPTTCSSSHTKAFDQDKVYGGSWYNWWSPPVDQIQEEIYYYGPVVAFFPCYEDLFYYKSGVYEHTSGELVGFHLTKLVGWGTDANGIDYWQAVNTWGVKWGENGTFRIRRGVNEVGIEERISGVLPKEAL